MKSGLTVLVAVLALAYASHGLAQEKLTAEKAFESIQALVGDWEAKLQSGKTISVNYKMMSNNSIMVETFTTPSGKQTISVYHLDRSHFLLTHYCAQGNQPRLRFNAKRSSPVKFVFEFYDVTNLSSSKAEHMVFLETAIIDQGHFNQTYTYRAGKEEDTTTLRFARVSKQT
jgi:hypothetical protein